jgi:hypothetical protein
MSVENNKRVFEKFKEKAVMLKVEMELDGMP